MKSLVKWDCTFSLFCQYREHIQPSVIGQYSTRVWTHFKKGYFRFLKIEIVTNKHKSLRALETWDVACQVAERLSLLSCLNSSLFSHNLVCGLNVLKCMYPDLSGSEKCCPIFTTWVRSFKKNEIRPCILPPIKCFYKVKVKSDN